MAHRYLRFRQHLAQHALAQFAASVKSTAEIVLLVSGPLLLGLFAMLALPPMAAATLPWFQAVPLLLLHGLLMSMPMLLLRKRVLPQDVVQWLHALPVPPRLQLAADALVAGMLAGPLALAYLVSAAIWLIHGPAWLAPLSGVGATVFSLLVTWAASTAILGLRARLDAPKARWQHHLRPAPASYAARGLRPLTLLLWHRLYWLPFWRAENVVGWQQSVLLCAAVACALGWMWVPAARGALDLCANTLLLVLTDRGDKAVREQAELLRPVMAPWPLQARLLGSSARTFALAPGLLVLAVLFAAGLAGGAWSHTAGRLYLVLACAVQLLLVTLPFNPRGRVGLVMAAIVMLTAVGSEVWN
ncbi:MAG: hypothetical protein V4508_13420 [Pseudomonadota bacterium]